MKESQIQAVIKEIDYEIISHEPAMDDYDGGVIEGLRIAREIVNKAPAQSDKCPICTPPTGPAEDPFRYHTRVM